MRKLFLIVLGLAAVLPAGAHAATGAIGDGTLSVVDAHGSVAIQARGAVLGRVAKGSVMIADLTPDDSSDPSVWGWETAVPRLDGSTTYRGDKMRFRLIGGSWKIVVKGAGIDISAVGRGKVWLNGDSVDSGVYSTAGDDCRQTPESCQPLPFGPVSFLLGASKG
jgi:hypothetical protein